MTPHLPHCRMMSLALNNLYYTSNSIYLLCLCGVHCAGVSIFLPLCGSWAWNLGSQAWQRVPLPSQSLAFWTPDRRFYHYQVPQTLESMFLVCPHHPSSTSLPWSQLIPTHPVAAPAFTLISAPPTLAYSSYDHQRAPVEFASCGFSLCARKEYKEDP